MQNIYYFNTGEFHQTKKELLKAVSGKDKKVFERAAEVENTENIDCRNDFSLLFNWCKDYASEF